MLQQFSHFFYRRVNPRLLGLFLLLELFFAGFLLPRCEKWIIPAGAQARILDLSFGFTPDHAYKSLRAYEELGRQRYLLVESLADTAYPLVYTGLFILLLSTLLRGIFPESSKWRLLNLWPLVAMLADYAENAGIISMLANYPTRLDGAAVWASSAGIVKWTAVASSAAIAVVALVWRLKNRISNKN